MAIRMMNTPRAVLYMDNCSISKAIGVVCDSASKISRCIDGRLSHTRQSSDKVGRECRIVSASVVIRSQHPELELLFNKGALRIVWRTTTTI